MESDKPLCNPIDDLFSGTKDTEFVTSVEVKELELCGEVACEEAVAKFAEAAAKKQCEEQDLMAAQQVLADAEKERQADAQKVAMEQAIKAEKDRVAEYQLIVAKKGVEDRARVFKIRKPKLTKDIERAKAKVFKLEKSGTESAIIDAQKALDALQLELLKGEEARLTVEVSNAAAKDVLDLKKQLVKATTEVVALRHAIETRRLSQLRKELGEAVTKSQSREIARLEKEIKISVQLIATGFLAEHQMVVPPAKVTNCVKKGGKFAAKRPDERMELVNDESTEAIEADE
jgi:hypothetical protein